MARIVRGRDGVFVRNDLEELYAQDRARGMPVVRAHLRFGRRLAGSVVSVAGASLRRPRLPRLYWIDLKLAARLIARHPGLSAVAGLTLAVGIPLCLAPMHLTRALNPTLPYEDPDRIVGIEYIDITRGHDETPRLHDLQRFRAELTSFDTIGTGRRIRENVAAAAFVDVRTGSHVTASAFDIPRARPLLGRTLRDADEAIGAQAVVVIGHALWQDLFGGASDVLGRALRVGGVHRQVVGVMPAGFQFPYRDEFWIPITVRPGIPAAVGERFPIFGRLRPGVSPAQAEAEIEALRSRLAQERPDVYGTLRADVTEFAFVVTGLTPSFDRVFPMYVASLLLLGVACANVGTLMLARTAGRTGEIAVRTALGASRARIVTQLFVESLVLSAIAAAVGLGLADAGLRRLEIVQFVETAMPPWFTLRLTTFSIAIAAGMVVFSAVIAGLLPALKATGKRTYSTLQGTGAAGVRFGMTASALIIAEVAIAVAGLSGVGSIAHGAFRVPSLGAGTAASETLTTQLRAAGDAAAQAPSAELSTRMATIQTEASRRLLAEPGVRAVAFAIHLPGTAHGIGRIEIEDDSSEATPPAGYVIRRAMIDDRFFEALGQRVLLGRNFEPRDLQTIGRPVIVNRSFVEDVLRGSPAIGRRLRYVRAPTEAPEPWRDVIGVVEDLGVNVLDPANAAGVYHVVAPGQVHPVHLLVRLSGPPESFVPRLRAVFNEIDPSMVLNRPTRLDAVFSEELWEARFKAFAFSAVAVSSVVLSAAGLYGLMAFSVAQRTREIAIRTALGASPGRIVRVVVRRAMIQLAAGVAIGATGGAVLIPSLLNSATLADNWRVSLLALSVAMSTIGLLACAVPTRRALRIQPIAALKDW